MRSQLPESFVRTTRWAYVKEGIEVGPYSAEEILDLLRKRQIAADTVLVELNSRRRSLTREVGPFAAFILELLEHEKRKTREREFKQAQERIARVARLRVLGFVGVAVLVLAGGIVALAVFNPFKPGQPKIIVDTPVAGVASETSEERGEEKAPNQEFGIVEATQEGEEGAESEEKVLAVVKKENMLSLTVENIADGNRKLEGPGKAPPIVRTSGKRAAVAPGQAPVAGGAKGAAGAGNGKGAIATLDFTDEEDEEELRSSGPVGLARERLSAVIRKCSREVMRKYGDTDGLHVSATALLQSSGRMSGLKLQVTPPLHVGDIKMCASVELMRMRVPPSESKEVPISVSLVVSASN